MNPIVRALIDSLLKYVETHPQVVDQLVTEGLAWLLATLEAARKAREAAAQKDSLNRLAGSATQAGPPPR